MEAATAYIAMHRFGLGPRGMQAPPANPRQWLLDQLDGWTGALAPDLATPLATRADVAGKLAEELADIRARPKVAPPVAQPVAGMPPSSAAAPTAPPPPPVDDPKQALRAFAREQYTAQVDARLRQAITSPAPFAEALVHFWGNHFAVSADKTVTIGLSGLLEFEAIRPHLLGRFEDLVLAVEQHPAMLLYLDQAQSVGPASPAGIKAKGRIGLNENLAREIMELHTMGVRSGYTQADVTEFARALTGWSVAGLAPKRFAQYIDNGLEPGSFSFAAFIHEGGSRRILGRRYEQDGEEQARAVLADLARHPATIHHICTKLAAHFVADTPPPALVARMERAWRKSDGTLRDVYTAMVQSDAAWAPKPAKFRDPWRWTVACLRGLTPPETPPLAKTNARAVAGMFGELGQQVWKPGSPAGYEDTTARWAAPDALLRRLELATRMAAQVPAGVDARQLAAAWLGPQLSPATARSIADAPSPRDGLALLLVAPEMLRS